MMQLNTHKTRNTTPPPYPGFPINPNQSQSIPYQSRINPVSRYGTGHGTRLGMTKGKRQNPLDNIRTRVLLFPRTYSVSVYGLGFRILVLFRISTLGFRIFNQGEVVLRYQPANKKQFTLEYFSLTHRPLLFLTIKC